MKQKWLPWAIAALILLLLLILFFLFFSSGDKKTNTNLAFPASGTKTQTAQEQGTQESGLYATNNPANVPTSAAGSFAQASNPSSNPATQQRYAPVYQTYSFPQTQSSPNHYTLTPRTPSTPSSITPIVITPRTQVSNQPVVFPSYYTSGTGPRVIGHARNGAEITFDPITGDLHVGEYHFNFGMGPVPNGATSDVVGDPENVALGTSIGIFIGSLLGNPGAGLAYGTALGSNLVSGHRLSDYGISLQGGMINLGGQDAISALGLNSDILGSSGLSSVTGSLGGGGGMGVFGGWLSIYSVCDYGTIYLVAGTPYSGLMMWVPGISDVPPYANAMGSPPVEGYAIGHYVGTSVCVLGDVTVGEGPVMYGYGTSL